MNILKVFIDQRIKNICPEMQLAIIRCNVINSVTSDELWLELNNECAKIKSAYQLLEINQRPAISATRQLYKALGKDPNRYRVSSEALCRRAVKGLALYRINTLVDLINILSIKSGYAIGGFDADKIVGNLTLTVGEKDQPFEAIGRGFLNIEGLPVYCDEIGGIGTPTSDEERTKITIDTTSLHININAFAEEMDLNEMVKWTEQLLLKYASATNINTQILRQ